MVAVLGSQKALSKKLGVSSSTISRLITGKGKIPKSLKSKLNSKWRYQNKRYLHQPRAKVKLDKYDKPVWISGNLVELENLEKAKEMLEEDLANRYEEVEIIKLRVKRFKAE